MIARMDLRATVKQRAIDLGFDLVGIAPAVPGRDLEFVREWLSRGYAGEMAYLSNPKRRDPKLVLPSIRSVICVGLIYHTPFPYSTEVASRQKAESARQKSKAKSEEPEPANHQSSSVTHAPVPRPSPSGRGCPDGIGTGEGESPRAWISRYAWGRDYHQIMMGKLEKFRAAIQELAPDAETRLFVDTGPVSERAFARFSGLGWMGKNTCIINEEKGSWFFLGVVLTSLGLEPDLAASDRCGSCTACLEACPTGALVEPYVMDASRCISYLTIELRGSIPQGLRKGVGSNIFGCDICQDVCPWNGKGRLQVPGSRCQETSFEPTVVSIQPPAEASPPSFQKSKSKKQNSPDARHPAPETFSLFNPSLAALAAMNEEQFRHTFRKSPIRRAKYRGWLRNLCVAMGNSGDARFIPKLQELAASSDPVVREHAEWALGRLKSRPR